MRQASRIHDRIAVFQDLLRRAEDGDIEGAAGVVRRGELVGDTRSQLEEVGREVQDLIWQAFKRLKAGGR